MMGNLVQSIWLLYGDARPSDIQEMVFRYFFFLHLTLIYLGGHVKTLPPSEKKMIKFFQTYITKQGCYHYYNMKIFVRSGP